MLERGVYHMKAVVLERTCKATELIVRDVPVK